MTPAPHAEETAPFQHTVLPDTSAQLPDSHRRGSRFRRKNPDMPAERVQDFKRRLGVAVAQVVDSDNAVGDFREQLRLRIATLGVDQLQRDLRGSPFRTARSPR